MRYAASSDVDSVIKEFNSRPEGHYNEEVTTSRIQYGKNEVTNHNKYVVLKRLARSFGPVMTAGSDAHVPEHVGTGYIEVSDTCRTWQDVLEEVRAGRVEVFSDSRKPSETIHYGVKSIVEWIFRGFKRM